MTSTLRLSYLASASLLALAGAAQAQSTADLFDLGEIVLEGEYDPSDPVPGYVATTAQTATKTGTPILETPQSISVITGEQIEDQGATTLGDTLGYTAGVTAQPYGTDPRFDAPTIRGFDGGDAQYLNGLRILRDFGAPSFEIYSLERIEVLKGPASVLYGSGIPGGVINQVQKRAQFLSFGEAGVGVGDPKATEAFVDYNHVFSDTFAARVTAVARESEEDVDELGNSRQYLGLATRWEPTEQTSLQFLGSWQKDSPITPTGVPYGLIGDEDDEDLRDYYGGDTDVDESDRRVLNLGFELAHQINRDWSAEASFRYQKFDWDFTGYNVYTAMSSYGIVDRVVTKQHEDNFTQNLDFRIRGHAETGDVAHALLFGLDLRRYGMDDETRFYYPGGTPFPAHPDDSAGLPAVGYVQQRDLTLTQLGVYAQDEVAIGNWRGSLALRHDWAEQSGDVSLGGAPYNADREDEATTGRAGLSYVFANGVAPYLSFTTSFDPQLGTDYLGKTYEPTTGRQWELGVKYQPLGFNGFFSAALYELTQENVLAASSDSEYAYSQIGEVRSQGLELEGTVDLENGWTLRGAYTRNLTEQTKGDNEGKQLPNAPLHNASLWANYSFAPDAALAGLTLGGGARYIGERYGDAPNAMALDSVTLFDLQASYAITEDMQLSVNVSNLTDEAYVASCTQYYGCYYGDGRTVQARLTYKW